MKLKNVALIGSVSRSSTEFVEHEVRRHFQEWMQEFPGSLFTLRCKGNELVFTTNSPELAEIWFQIEKPFVECMLNLDTADLRTKQQHLFDGRFRLSAA